MSTLNWILLALILVLVVAIVLSIRELVRDFNRTTRGPDDDPANVQPAPRHIARGRIVCSMREAPDCWGVLYEGDPGGALYMAPCEACRQQLLAKSRGMTETLRRLAS